LNGRDMYLGQGNKGRAGDDEVISFEKKKGGDWASNLLADKGGDNVAYGVYRGGRDASGGRVLV